MSVRSPAADAGLCVCSYLRALPCSAELVAADLYFRQSGCCHTVAESFSKIFSGVKHLNYTDDGGRALR